MAEFQELIKNFDRIRDYMRQFYIYGFKARTEYAGKSARTYDNERRRIESWLADYTRADYTARGKHVYINVDSKEIPQNPLYAAWKSKSFTDNDLMLHFFLLDQLAPCGRDGGVAAASGARDRLASAAPAPGDCSTCSAPAPGDCSTSTAPAPGDSPNSAPAPGDCHTSDSPNSAPGAASVSPSPAFTAGELCDRICAACGTVFDSQTMRLKLKEYEKLGILVSIRDGKQLRYSLAPLLAPETSPTGAWEQLITAVEFFQGAAPFGFIGSTILDREEEENKWFQFKHQFIVHTLEDGVLADVLAAIRDGYKIAFTNRSSRTGNVSQGTGLPLKIFVSTRTGRRYVCMYMEDTRRFINVRLDAMSEVKTLEIKPDFRRKQDLLRRNLDRLWGVSFSGSGRLEEICVKLYINEQKEAYVLDRLRREGRTGQIQRIRENEYLYTGSFFDTNEMLSWIKTFTGRVLDIQGSNRFAVAKITYDWEKMYEMYCNSPADDQEEL